MIEKNNNLSLFVYTNSDYHDVLIPCLKRIRKYFPSERVYVASNETNNSIIENGCIFIEYNNDLIYSEKLYQTLNKIQEEYIVYLHEDMILYDKPNLEEIMKIKEIMETKRIDFVRFCINDGTQDQEVFIDSNLRSYIGEYYFSVQPTIWKTESLKQFMEKESKGIWDLESFSQKSCRERFKGYTYSTLKEKKRGLGHKDSLIFPYMATAVTKGKWNISEYREEILNMFEEYNLDKKVRGTNAY
jgi:hypothetical protein